MGKFINENLGLFLILSGILAIALAASIQWSLTGLLGGGGVACLFSAWIWLDKS